MFKELLSFAGYKFTPSEASNNIFPAKLPQRKSNISFYDTIRELCDNSIDANATEINIYLHENHIVIIDNGNGMTSSQLDNAFKLNSSNPEKKETSIGKWGVGLKQSIIQLNKDKDDVICYVLTGHSSYPNNYFFNEFYPKYINEKIEEFGIDGWKIPPAKNQKDISDHPIKNKMLLTYYYDYINKKEDFNSGTVILVKNTSVPELDNSKSIEETKANLHIHLGECYFSLLGNEIINIKINNVSVKPKDFLLRNLKSKIVTWEYIRKDIPTPLKFTLAITPKAKDLKDKNITPYLPINNNNNGIYLSCNDVVISRANKKHIVTKNIEQFYKSISKKRIRKTIFPDAGDNYFVHLRILIECDGYWQKYIQLDQEKINYTFHDELAEILADLMHKIDEYSSHSYIDKEEIIEEENNFNIKQEPKEEPVPVTQIIKPEIISTPELIIQKTTMESIVNNDQNWNNLIESILEKEDSRIVPLLKSFADEIRSSLNNL